MPLAALVAASCLFCQPDHLPALPAAGSIMRVIELFREEDRHQGRLEAMDELEAQVREVVVASESFAESVDAKLIASRERALFDRAVALRLRHLEAMGACAERLDGCATELEAVRDQARTVSTEARSMDATPAIASIVHMIQILEVSALNSPGGPEPSQTLRAGYATYWDERILNASAEGSIASKLKVVGERQSILIEELTGQTAPLAAIADRQSAARLVTWLNRRGFPAREAKPEFTLEEALGCMDLVPAGFFAGQGLADLDEPPTGADVTRYTGQARATLVSTSAPPAIEITYSLEADSVRLSDDASRAQALAWLTGRRSDCRSMRGKVDGLSESASARTTAYLSAFGDALNQTIREANQLQTMIDTAQAAKRNLPRPASGDGTSS